MSWRWTSTGSRSTSPAGRDVLEHPIPLIIDSYTQTQDLSCPKRGGHFMLARGMRRLMIVAFTLGLCASLATAVGEAAPMACSAPAVGTESVAPGGPGWTRTFVDEFNRCGLGPNWGAYSGQPGGNTNSQWSPSMVTVSGGMLHLRAVQREGSWITGGVANISAPQLYGKWEVRFRVQASDEVSFHLLLWPQANVWPPEIDFLESNDGTRRSASAAVHYWGADGSKQKTMRSVRGDFTRWTRVGVEWLPGQVRYLLNGKVWATASGPLVSPGIPMWLAMQIESGACQQNAKWGILRCPSAGIPPTMQMDVDWVGVYAPASGTALLSHS